MQKKIELYTDWCHFWRNRLSAVLLGCRRMQTFSIRCFELGGVEPAAELGLELKTSLSLLYLPVTPIQKKKEKKKKKKAVLYPVPLIHMLQTCQALSMHNYFSTFYWESLSPSRGGCPCFTTAFLRGRVSARRIIKTHLHIRNLWVSSERDTSVTYSIWQYCKDGNNSKLSVEGRRKSNCRKVRKPF